MTSFSPYNSTTTILRLLELTKRDPKNLDIVHTHIKSILTAVETEKSQHYQAYSTLLSTLMSHHNENSDHGSSLRQHLSLLKLRLESQPSTAELNEINRLFCEALKERNTAVTLKPNTNTEPFVRDEDAINQDEIETTTQHIDPVPTPLPPITEQPQANNEFKLLEQKRKRMAEIQASLSRHLTEVAEQNRALGEALNTERNNINKNHDAGELKTLKLELSNEISTLLQGHHSLTEKLDNATKFLEMIESEGQDLSNELKKAHTLSLTDELTQLPNRRAFYKRIEDEVSRVQRYEYPLCLALVDLDAFKSINDRYGHNTGDDVLRSFAERALSGFRHHDLASRYGGEEFAVILPNTDIAGAQRALEKVRGRASQCTFQYNGTTHPIPTFSAGLALYHAGETPEAFIERADQLLYRAKRMGRNRIEIAEDDAIKNSEGMQPPQSRA